MKCNYYERVGHLIQDCADIRAVRRDSMLILNSISTLFTTEKLEGGKLREKQSYSTATRQTKRMQIVPVRPSPERTCILFPAVEAARKEASRPLGNTDEINTSFEESTCVNECKI